MGFLSLYSKSVRGNLCFWNTWQFILNDIWFLIWKCKFFLKFILVVFPNLAILKKMYLYIHVYLLKKYNALAQYFLLSPSYYKYISFFFLYFQFFPPYSYEKQCWNSLGKCIPYFEVSVKKLEFRFFEMFTHVSSPFQKMYIFVSIYNICIAFKMRVFWHFKAFTRKLKYGSPLVIIVSNYTKAIPLTSI